MQALLGLTISGRRTNKLHQPVQVQVQVQVTSDRPGRRLALGVDTAGVLIQARRETHLVPLVLVV